MRLRSPLVGLVVVAFVVLAGAVPAGVASAAGGTHADREAVGDALAQSAVETDNVRLVVSIAKNGSAHWKIQYWTRLDDQNTTRAFESLQQDVEANPRNYSRQFAQRMRSTVAAAENATGREMAVENVSVRAETRGPPQYGVVTYSFQWEGFAAVNGNTIRVGDAIEGIFLDSDTRLIVGWPSDYRAVTVTPDADERRSDTVVWRGSETEFVADEPSIVLKPEGALGAVPGGGGGSGSGDQSGSTLTLALGVLIALGVAGAVAWWLRRRTADTEGEPAADAAAVGGVDDGPPADGEAGTAADADTDPDPRPELLSNEERVLKFVRDRGGRVKQQEVVSEFDWTEARTSQIVRQLRDDGDLEGFRLGRENVLKLPDGDEADVAPDATDREEGDV